MDWTPEQKQAIEKKGSNILVAAAAGSGKTAVLVERIINKILYEKIDIDKLLVVTFTNAAAAEMRERILKAIYKKIEESKDLEEINNLQRQVVLLNKASICTIDSFCGEIVKNNFFEKDISPNYRIGDASEITLLKQEILEELFEEKYEEKNEDFQKLIKTYTSYKDDTPLKDLILKIHDYTSSSPYPKQWLEDSVEKYNNIETEDFACTEWGKILLQEFKEEVQEDIAILSKEAEKLSEEIDLQDYKNILENDVKELKILEANLDNWDKAYSIASKVDFIKWKGPKIQSIAKDNAKSVRDKIKIKYNDKMEKFFTANTEEAIRDIKDMYDILSKLKNLIFEFEDRLMKKKKERNILEFADVEHLALQILEDEEHNRTEVAKKYQQKFEEIAIDEYQDSNFVQEKILKAVSRDNNIFMVGDIKQSIYRFRQARPELFLEKYKTYSKKEPNEKGLKIQLFSNFRSRKNILDFTNEIFKKIMSEELGEIEYTEEEYLNYVEGWNDIKIENEIDIIDVKKIEKEEKSEEEETIEDTEIEAKFVAKKIKELVESKFKVYDKNTKENRDIEYRDIAILLHTTKGKAPIYEKELMEQNIPVYSDMSSLYIESMEIQTILSLLKIIDNPYQDIPLVTVMRSPIGKFTDNELVEIRLADKKNDFYTAVLKATLSVTTELKQKIEDFLNKIEKWRKEQEFLSLDELIWKIYEDTGFLNYMGVLPNGSLRQANLKMLFERAKQYESASFKGLFNFIRFIEKLSLSSKDLSSAKMIGENEQVVRIMSIHKSKGLEFPVVFLANTATNFNFMDLNQSILLDQDLGIGVKYIDYDMQIKFDTLAKRALRNKALTAQYSEEMRVLYVALTRAKEKLYITATKKNYDKFIENLETNISIYKNKGKKINPILIKKYKSFIDWILLVNYGKMKINKYSKNDLIKELKPEEKEELDLFKLIEERTKDVKEEEIKQIENTLSFKYEFEEATRIPSKTSITAIAHKKMEEIKEDALQLGENGQINDKELTLPVPKFLIGKEEEKITSAKHGTLIHLCMQKLDFSKDYKLEDIKEMIQNLVQKQIITEKEAKSINPYDILKFTKTEIWKELKTSKENHKEEPFYINILANEALEISCEENILVQGIIDLYYITEDDKLILLDYKTDYINEGEEEILIKRHTPQLMLYKEALENALDRKVDKMYIYSTVLGKEIVIGKDI